MSEESKLPVLRERRITVAISTGLRNLDVLELAAALAAADQAEVEALFVEDVRLFQLAGLPFARELDTCSGAEQPLREARINADLRSRLNAVERALARAVAPHHVRSSLRIRRGDYLAEALSVSETVDVLILVREQAARGAVRRRAQGAAELFVLFDGSPAAERALELGRRLAAQRGAGLCLLLDRSIEEASTLQAAAQRLLGRQTARIEGIASTEPTSLAQAPGLNRGVLLGPLARLAAGPAGSRLAAALPAPVLILVA